MSKKLKTQNILEPQVLTFYTYPSMHMHAPLFVFYLSSGDSLKFVSFFVFSVYESELAPEGYKENARQHPRAVPVISEKHVLPSSVKQGSVSSDKETQFSPNNTAGAQTMASKSTTTSPSKTITETVTEKLAPAYATVSDATHAIASKIQGLAISATSAVSNSQPNSAPAQQMHAPSQHILEPAPASLSARNAPQSMPDSAAAQTGKHANSVDRQIWDKGVSVKEFLMNKFEPGEDERALSQVISEAMSPKNTAGDGGVMEKMKGAVTSLLRHEEPPSNSATHFTRSTTMTPTSHIPVSTNVHEGVCVCIYICGLFLLLFFIHVHGVSFLFFLCCSC